MAAPCKTQTQYHGQKSRFIGSMAVPIESLVLPSLARLYISLSPRLYVI